MNSGVHGDSKGKKGKIPRCMVCSPHFAELTQSGPQNVLEFSLRWGDGSEFILVKKVLGVE